METIANTVTIKAFDNGSEKHFCELLKSHKVMVVRPREFQCMSLWIAGNSAKKIGQILSLSHRTVHTHTNNIRLRNEIFSREEVINRLIIANQYHNVIFYAEFLRKEFLEKAESL